MSNFSQFGWCCYESFGTNLLSVLTYAIIYLSIKEIFDFLKRSEYQTRPSFNYAKDWLDQLLLIPGLVLSGREKGITYGSGHYGAVNNHFTVYWAIFGMVTNKHQNTQPVDPRASELLTSEKAVFCNEAPQKRYFHKTWIHWQPNNIVDCMNLSHFVNVVRWARFASFRARRHRIVIKRVNRKFLQLLQEQQKVHFIFERLSHLQINSHANMFPLLYSQIV